MSGIWYMCMTKQDYIHFCSKSGIDQGIQRILYSQCMPVAYKYLFPAAFDDHRLFGGRHDVAVAANLMNGQVRVLFPDRQQIQLTVTQKNQLIRKLMLENSQHVFTVAVRIGKNKIRQFVPLICLEPLIRFSTFFL